MKRTAIFLLVSLLAFATLTGCGNNENTTDEPSSTPTVEPSPTDEPTTEGSIEALPTETPTPIPTEPPHEHNYTEVEGSAVEATCTTDGKKADKVCECGDKVEGEVVKAIGHAYEANASSAKEPTCEKDGKKADKVCTLCGDTINGEAIPATGHNYETDASSAKNATCDADGKKVDTKCSLCGDIIRGAVIPATGHSYGKYTYNNDATTEKDGTETATCVCGLTDTRTKTGTKIEICPYERYVIKYDNMGLPYFYGKWGGSANMDAENNEKTDACMSQMVEEIKALATRNYEYPNEETGFIHRGYISPGYDIAWKLIGTYEGEKIVVRYVNELFYRFPTEIFGQRDITKIRWESEPIVVDKSLEERGIETTGNGVW